MATDQTLTSFRQVGSGPPPEMEQRHALSTQHADMNQFQPGMNQAPQDGQRMDFMMEVFKARGLGNKQLELPKYVIQTVMGPSFNEPSFLYQDMEIFEEGKMVKELEKRNKTVQEICFPRG